MVALIQGENYAANKGKTAGSYQFDTNPTGIGLIQLILGMTWYISTCGIFHFWVWTLDPPRSGRDKVIFSPE